MALQSLEEEKGIVAETILIALGLDELLAAENGGRTAIGEHSSQRRTGALAGLEHRLRCVLQIKVGEAPCVEGLRVPQRIREDGRPLRARDIQIGSLTQFSQ